LLLLLEGKKPVNDGDEVEKAGDVDNADDVTADGDENDEGIPVDEDDDDDFDLIEGFGIVRKDDEVDEVGSEETGIEEAVGRQFETPGELVVEWNDVVVDVDVDGNRTVLLLLFGLIMLFFGGVTFDNLLRCDDNNSPFAEDDNDDKSDAAGVVVEVDDDAGCVVVVDVVVVVELVGIGVVELLLVFGLFALFNF